MGWGGDRCPAAVCFLGCLGPHLHPWVTHLPTSCSSCSSASGMSLAFSLPLLLSYLSLPPRSPLHSFSNYRLRREQIHVFSQGLGLQSQAGQGGETPQATLLSEGGGDPLKLRPRILCEERLQTSGPSLFPGGLGLLKGEECLQY